MFVPGILHVLLIILQLHNILTPILDKEINVQRGSVEGLKHSLYVVDEKFKLKFSYIVSGQKNYYLIIGLPSFKVHVILLASGLLTN
jgi:hypothetical protein